MTTRKERLKKLVVVQEQLKAMHEMRHAGFVAQAINAEAEARELAESMETTSAITQLFPDLYYNRIAAAVARQKINLGLASHEAGQIAAATARTNMVERAYQDVRRQDERDSADRERLEIIERKLADDK